MLFIALLFVAGAVIPFSPVKYALEPASFTLACHTPIFIAMFISPLAALTVAAGTTLGFACGGFPAVVVLRAASHGIFALLGAWYLQYRPEVLSSLFRAQLFSLVIGIIHVWVEVTVVCFFYMDGNASGAFTSVPSILLLVGLCGLAHSMVDFTLALAALKLLTASPKLAPVFVVGKPRE
ncbi:hypothetical protein FACS1894139_08090 [Planctomycetales bacterium]|nr:hypothetical protein FACS1894107_00170 [Planctomycetales bacterium]GHS96269.1 hypothetical protein FACS1894108_00610 [Planctomycetales bacterium]GHT05001.1 hypothetical protein FACS1894139_08090 [Planctomycetales bacterium]